MKKLLTIIATLMMTMFMFAGCGESEPPAPEVTEADIIGTWQESDNLYDGESDGFNVEEEDPDWVGYYVFNEDGTGSEWTGENGVTTDRGFTWVLEGETIVCADETFPSQTEELVYTDGNLVKDHTDYVEGMEIIFSKID